MHNDLLMHVAAFHVQDQLAAGAYRRRVREARRATETAPPSRRLRAFWPLRRAAGHIV